MRGFAAVAVVLALFAGGHDVAGQTFASGVLTGRVADDRGDPLNAVTITITSRNTGQALIRQSSRSGAYASGLLSPGVYDALYERLGFQPERWESIVVGPGERVELDVRLEAATGPVDSAFVYLAPPRRSVAQRWLTGRFAALPLESGDLSTIAALSSRAGPLLEVEGLPAAAHSFIVDGVPLAPRTGRIARNAALSALSLPTLGYAHLDVEALDPELPGTAGAHFSGLTLRGSRRTSGYAFGDYSGDAVAAAADAAPFQSYRVGGQVSGGIVGDTAQFIVGAEYQRSERPFESVWAPDALVDQLQSTADQVGTNLSPWTEPVAVLADKVSAFGRLDLRLGSDHGLNVQGRFSTLPTLEMIAPRTGQLLTVGSAPDTREVLASATLTSNLSDRDVLEVTFGFENGRVQRERVDDELAPSTEVVSAGRRFGVDDPFRTDSDLLGLYGRATVHLNGEEHRFKAGVWVSYQNYDLEWTEDRASRFTFDTPADLVAGTGAFRTTTGVASRSDFNAQRWAVYAQDTWTPRTGLEVVAGARLTVYQFTDTADINFNSQWFSATGIDSNVLPDRKRHFDPHFSLSWNPGGEGLWLLRLAASVNGEGAWPETVAEVVANDGNLAVFSGVGDLGSWPTTPDTLAAGRVGPTLTILGPEFTGPRSTRVSAGITGSLGPVAVGVSGTLRTTDFLPERRDINLLPTPALRDQHGRPIYGPLVKVGGLLAPDPGVNRRIPEFARVSVIEATATSRYTGVTFSIERPFANGVALFGNYTYSVTEDDWLWGDGLDPESQLSPFPDSLSGVDWADGRSDFDVPHRISVGAEFKVPGRFGPRIAALYRYQSGYPFTPGFRDGVDINADGSGRNDPVFIDNAIAGTSELVSAWPCVSDQISGFVERNACRGPDYQALDARFSLDFVRTDQYAAQLVIDGLDLIASEIGVVDRAVYLIDPSRDLSTGPAGRVVTVPLVANPNFGELLTRYSPQRQLRIGLRVSY